MRMRIVVASQTIDLIDYLLCASGFTEVYIGSCGMASPWLAHQLTTSMDSDLARDTARDFQILLVWGKDRHLRPMPLHRRAGSEFLVVLSGAIMISIDAESCVI